MSIDTVSALCVSTPVVRFGESPHHAVCGHDGGCFSSAYCLASERDRTMSEAYDLYYKGSLIDSLTTMCFHPDITGKMCDENNAIVTPSGDVLTFKDFYSRIRDVGRGFVEQGMNPRDRAIIYVPSSTANDPIVQYQWLQTCYGLWAFGLHAVVASTEKHVTNALKETNARLVLTTADGLEVLERIGTDTTRIVGLGSVAHSGFGITFEDLVSVGSRANVEEQRTMPLPEPDMIALIVYSHHTPHRGIVFTHGNLQAAVYVTRIRLQSQNSDTPHVAVVEPFAHIAPFVLANSALFATGSISFGYGSCVPVSSHPIVACTHNSLSQARKSFGDAAELLLFSLPSRDDASSSSDDDTDTKASYWYSPIAACGVGLMHMFEAKKRQDGNSDSIALMPGIEMRFRMLDCDAADTQIRRGEVMLKGPCISKGYFIDDKTLDEVDRTMLSDGWLPTGDVAEISDAGDVRIIGRLCTSHES